MTEFVRMEDSIKDAILTIMKYVHLATGVEPTQDEISGMLKSYFILNEISNQFKYQLKKTSEEEKNDKTNIRDPFWRLNLMTGPRKNNLANAGFFHRSIQEAVQVARDFVKKTTGVAPSNDILARSLKSSFILSEIKNQIEWQRKKTQNENGNDDDLFD